MAAQSPVLGAPPGYLLSSHTTQHHHPIPPCRDGKTKRSPRPSVSKWRSSRGLLCPYAHSVHTVPHEAETLGGRVAGCRVAGICGVGFAVTWLFLLLGPHTGHGLYRTLGNGVTKRAAPCFFRMSPGKKTAPFLSTRSKRELSL